MSGASLVAVYIDLDNVVISRHVGRTGPGAGPVRGRTGDAMSFVAPRECCAGDATSGTGIDVLVDDLIRHANRRDVGSIALAAGATPGRGVQRARGRGW